MENWQGHILNHFKPTGEQLLLVVDPDNLLRDTALLAEIQRQNFDILDLQEEISFRNRFERSYRSLWDDGQARKIVVVVHTTDMERHIPFDLWKKSKRIELSVSDLFPNLNAIVVRQLDNAYYGLLYPAHQQLLLVNQILRQERQTIEFILRVVFNLDAMTIGKLEDWVKFLIQKHYRRWELPPALEDYLLEKMLPKVTQAGIKAAFLQESDLFYAWLGESWSSYIKAVQEGKTCIIDFSTPELQVLLAQLFAEGILPRINLDISALSSEFTWMAVGTEQPLDHKIGDKSYEQMVYTLNARLSRFQEADQSVLPAGQTDLRDWLNLAAEWAEAVFQGNSLPGEYYKKVQPSLSAARKKINREFENFIRERYSAIDYYQDNQGPISLAAVNRWLLQNTKKQERVALVCFDGLALDQWLLLRNFLQKKIPSLSWEENRTFALAPTVTPISRQALFAGKLPVQFSETANKTDQDGNRWGDYWRNQDIPPQRIAYLHIRTATKNFSDLTSTLDTKNVRLGIVINLFDDAMHEIKQNPVDADKRILYDTVQSQLENGYLHQIFEMLMASQYRIFITSDHGNAAGIGVGITPPKALVESYARRVAIFDQAGLAEDFENQHDAFFFRTKNLPLQINPVYLANGKMFASTGASLISHGGLSLEELVVPFIEVKYK